MSTMLEKMRARVNQRSNTGGGNTAIFTHWKLDFGKTCTLRFLPYNDPYTGAFWAERVLLPMTFTDPEDAAKVIKVMAPCREMYVQGEKCPALRPVRDLYSEERELRNSGATQDADKLKKIAGAHWKKPTYYYQGFVIKAGFTEDETPENLIRVFPFNKQIHKMVFSSIFEAEEDGFEKLPTGEFTIEDVRAFAEGEGDIAMFEGFNYTLKKSQQGDYANWTQGSNWSRSASTLEPEHLAALAEHGFHDLTKHLPQRPSEEAYEVLAEMMEVSVQRMLTGENGVYNKDWEEATGIKPVRDRSSGSSDNAASSKPAARSKPAASAAPSSSAKDALAALKAKRGKAESAEDEAPAEEVAEAAPVAEEVTEAPEASTPAPTSASDLAAKIKARVSGNAA